MNRLVILLAMLTACSDTSGPVPLQDFDVSASLSTVPTTVVTENGRWEGCQTTWVFSTNDSHPTIYYSVGPGLTAAVTEWWENGSFRNRGEVSLFVPTGRSIEYLLWRVQGTTEVWRKESGSRQISC